MANYIRPEDGRELSDAQEWHRRRNLYGVTVRYMYGTRTTDAKLSKLGVDYGSRTEVLKRGKIVDTTYVLPPITE